MTNRINWHLRLPAQAGKFLRWSRNLLLLGGGLLSGYCVLMLLDSYLFEIDQNGRFQQALKNRRVSNDAAGETPLSSPPASGTELASPRIESPLADGDAEPALGRIEIGSIGLAAMIMEGTDATTLRRAAGHIPGTSLPGQPGNVAIAGHRDTIFRALRHIRQNDEITLLTLAGSYRYRVTSIKVVEPDDTAVLNNSGTATLTLVTCYPFHFVGPAPQRFIVRARCVFAEAWLSPPNQPAEAREHQPGRF